MSKKLGWILFGVTTLVFLIGAVAVATGNAYFGFKRTNQTAVLQAKKVCDAGIIKKYNELYRIRESENRAESFKGLVGEIEGKKDFANDATCDFIITKYYLSQKDIDKAAQSLKLLEKSIGEGNAVDNSTYDLVGASVLNNELEIMRMIKSNGLGDPARVDSGG